MEAALVLAASPLYYLFHKWMPLIRFSLLNQMKGGCVRAAGDGGTGLADAHVTTCVPESPRASFLVRVPGSPVWTVKQTAVLAIHGVRLVVTGESVAGVGRK